MKRIPTQDGPLDGSGPGRGRSRKVKAGGARTDRAQPTAPAAAYRTVPVPPTVTQLTPAPTAAQNLECWILGLREQIDRLYPRNL